MHAQAIVTRCEREAELWVAKVEIIVRGREEGKLAHDKPRLYILDQNKMPPRPRLEAASCGELPWALSQPSAAAARESVCRTTAKGKGPEVQARSEQRRERALIASPKPDRRGAGEE